MPRFGQFASPWRPGAMLTRCNSSVVTQKGIPFDAFHKNFGDSQNWKNIPVVKELQRYFGKSLPIINDETRFGRSHCVLVMVVAPILNSYDSLAFEQSDKSIKNIFCEERLWTYNVIGNDGGYFVSNASEIDSLIYSFHSCLFDGVLTSINTLLDEPHTSLYTSNKMATIKQN